MSISREEAAAAADEGFEVTDEVNPDEVGDLSDQKSSDWIEPHRNVQFSIKQGSCLIVTSLDETKDGGDGITWLTKNLRVQAQINPLGVDGEGLYAGKLFFPDFLVILNLPALKEAHERKVADGKKPKKPFNEKWWRTESRVDFKEFALAVGLARMVEKEGGGTEWKMIGPINDDMLSILGSGDVEFIANITKVPDSYRGEDMFKNKLKRFRALPQGEES